MMISQKTGISWTDTTLNPWVGCVAVSDGCTNCYANTLVTANRGKVFRRPFNEVDVRLERLAQLRRLGPIAEKGVARPRMIFVNSVSDFFFEQVSDAVIHTALDAFEQYPRTVFQILTKRPVRARKLLSDRYGNSGVPANLWFGASVEDNRVAARLNVMRRLKDATGGNMTLFASVEPIVGPTDAIDFTGLDWVITGGESGPRSRVMQRAWLLPSIENARKAGARLWHKQSGTMQSHPNLSEAPAGGITMRFQWLVDNGWESLPDEKGGATVDRATYRDLPLAYDQLKAKMNDSLI
jgi:protein gp37